MKNTTIALLIAGVFSANVTAQSIRALYPLSSDDETNVAGVSRSGDAVVVTGNSGSHAFLWNGGELQTIPPFEAGSAVQATAISASGQVIAGYSPSVSDDSVDPSINLTNWAFIKTGATAPQKILPPAGYDYLAVNGLSGDGSTLLVTAYVNDPVKSEPFRWSHADGYEDLGRYADPIFQDPVGPNLHAVNASGSIIIGWASYQLPPLKWTTAFPWTAFADDNWVYNEGSIAVNSDGTVVLGNQLTNDANDRETPWRWVSGVKTALPALATGDSMYLYGASADCTLAIGQNWLGSVRTPVVWTSGTGTRSLVEVLSPSIDLTGWVLKKVETVSADGRVFAGEGTYQGRDTMFVASLDTVLPEGPTPPSPTPSPTPAPAPTIEFGKVPKVTTKSVLVVRGRSLNATSVEFTVNKLKAKRTSVKGGAFSFKAKLTVGKNKVRVRSHGVGGDSSWQTFKVKRESAD